MARHEDIERRLHNWARWRHGMCAGGMGFAKVDLTAVGDRDAARGAIVPTVDCEAEETDRAVMALAGPLRATVETVYLGAGSMAKKAGRLCCTEATVYARINQAHRQISNWLAELAAMQRDQRERMEALQRSARP